MMQHSAPLLGDREARREHGSDGRVSEAVPGTIMIRHLDVARQRIMSGDLRGAQRNIEYARSRMAALIGPPLMPEGDDA